MGLKGPIVDSIMFGVLLPVVPNPLPLIIIPPTPLIINIPNIL